MSRTIKLLIISILLLFTTSCMTTLPILTMLGTVGVASNKFVDYKLTKRSLDLKEREIKLKENVFDQSKKEY